MRRTNSNGKTAAVSKPNIKPGAIKKPSPKSPKKLPLNPAFGGSDLMRSLSKFPKIR